MSVDRGAHIQAFASSSQDHGRIVDCAHIQAFVCVVCDMCGVRVVCVCGLCMCVSCRVFCVCVEMVVRVCLECVRCMC